MFLHQCNQKNGFFSCILFSRFFDLDRETAKFSCNKAMLKSLLKNKNKRKTQIIQDTKKYGSKGQEMQRRDLEKQNGYKGQIYGFSRSQRCIL